MVVILNYSIWTWLLLILIGPILLILVLSFIGGLITFLPLPISKKKLADEIEYLIDLTEGRHPEETYADRIDNAFIQRIWNRDLERIRQLCLRIADLHPPEREFEYCDEEGILELKKILKELRAQEQGDT